jgi:hypothetical protein
LTPDRVIIGYLSGVNFFDLPVLKIILLVRLAALFKFLRDCSDHIAVGFIPRLISFRACSMTVGSETIEAQRRQVRLLLPQSVSRERTSARSLIEPVALGCKKSGKEKLRCFALLNTTLVLIRSDRCSVEKKTKY